VVRQALAPLVIVHVRVVELVSLNVGGAKLAPDADRVPFRATLAFPSYVSWGAVAAGPDKVDLGASYQTTRDGMPESRPDDRSATWPAAYGEATLNNVPAVVGLLRGEIRALETFAGADELEKSKAAQMYGWCAEHTTNRSEFGQYVCSLGYEMINVLSRRV